MKFSIITPTYNREDCIGRCIESVIRNLSSKLNFEHIIVDDGSTDGTAEIVDSYVKKNPHIKFIKFERNRGTNAARNAAIASAAGDFCIILDSDDYFVDDAMKKIDAAIAENPQFIHYLFVPSDRMEYMNNNALLVGKKTQVLSFVDFLSDKVTGDFIHVLKTSTLRKYPFDEQLRIYEGPFFLRFYKEAGHILFTNKIVTIRERSRSDSVTRDTFKTSRAVIEKDIKSVNSWFCWFQKDCTDLGLFKTLCDKRIIQLRNYLLLSDYSKSKEQINAIRKFGGKIPLILNTVYTLRLGYILRLISRWYLILKYDILKKQLK